MRGVAGLDLPGDRVRRIVGAREAEDDLVRGVVETAEALQVPEEVVVEPRERLEDAHRAARPARSGRSSHRRRSAARSATPWSSSPAIPKATTTADDHECRIHVSPPFGCQFLNRVMATPRFSRRQRLISPADRPQREQGLPGVEVARPVEVAARHVGVLLQADDAEDVVAVGDLPRVDVGRETLAVVPEVERVAVGARRHVVRVAGDHQGVLGAARPRRSARSPRRRQTNSLMSTSSRCAERSGVERSPS